MKTYPLLQSQIGVYHAWTADPTSVAYNLPAVVPFSLNIDIGRLEQALHTIWETRQELHTQFTINSKGEPCQWADSSLEFPFTCRQSTEEEALQYIEKGFVRPFETLNGQPLVRFEVIKTEVHHYLLFDMHHLICDGLTLSLAFLNNDLPTAYEGKPLAPHPYGLYQHAEAEQASFNSDNYQRDALFYQEHFHNIDFISLSDKVADPWGQRIEASATLDIDTINLWCQHQNTTPNHLFMAAFSIVLACLSGNQKVAFIALHHGRTDHRLAQAYGMFVSSFPVLVQIDEGQRVSDFISQLRRWTMSTIRHQTYPITHLCRDLRKTPSTTFAFQGSNILEQTTTGGEVTQGYQPVQGITKNDLSCTIYTKGKHYEIRTEASASLWSQQRLQRMANAVAACVQNLMEHPNGTLADIDIITNAQKAELLQMGQGKRLDYDLSQTFVSLFLNQVKRTPQALAVTDGETSLTYEELNCRSAALATYMMQNQSVKPGDHVAIATGQHTAFLVAAIAVARIGAAYVPIDTDWPESRKRYIMEDAQVVATIDGHEDLSSTTPISLDFNRTSPSYLAYIIYTSGTTGQPKGVMIPHHALLNFVHSIVNLFGLTAESRISCHSSVAFDASVEDLFPALTVGGSVHIMPESIRRDLPKMHQFILDHHITGGCYTTHLGVMLAQQFQLPLDYLCLGGERLSTCPDTSLRVFNTYGPTEFTVDATYCLLQGQTPPPIGRPLPNLKAYVVDNQGHLLPRGEVGELQLAGPQMAKGYWKQPLLTQEAFVENPHVQAQTYRTGDLVRWNEEGQLEYIGRKDRQLKLHGYRIEPDEIEQQLLQIDGIRHAAVTIIHPHDKPQLCAYFTAEGTLTEDFLTEQLNRNLPPYMVPSLFCQLSEMPLTTAGKTDYLRLPQPTLNAPADVAPANEEERLWCDLFAQVTGAAHVGATDNFFHIGGTSILVASLQAEALRHGIHLAYGDVFAYPTPQALTQHFNNHQTDVPDGGQPMSPTSVNRRPRCRQRGSGSAPIGDILLTGATGFLGRHVLIEYLNTETGTAYCLVRSSDEAHAYQRLLETLDGTGVASHLGTRIIPIAGDLQSFTPHQLPATINSVIHCAADTRHFAADNIIEDTNIYGTDRIISFCLAKSARLIHISTLSVALLPQEDAKPNRHTGLHNPYIQSKAIAEQHILKAIAHQGLQATIMRIGNLATPQGQAHGGLLDALDTFRFLGAYPQSIADLPIDISPVQLTARAILLLATHATNGTILHPYNPHTTTLAAYLQQHGNPKPVSDTQFQNTLQQAMNNPERLAMLVPLLHYQAMNTTQGIIPALPDNSQECQLLEELGFVW